MKDWKTLSEEANCFAEKRKLWAKYKWEFMRRDPEYIKAYEDIIMEPNKEKEKIYCRYFEILPWMMDPGKSFEDLTKNNSFMEAFFISKLIGKLPAVAEKATKEKNLLIIEIDFNRINSIDAVKQEINHIIDRFFLQHIKLNRRPLKLLKLYDDILLTGDLKSQNPGMTWIEISNRVLPENMIDPDSASKRVQGYYRRYLKEIRGGWRKFRFP